METGMGTIARAVGHGGACGMRWRSGSSDIGPTTQPAPNAQPITATDVVVLRMSPGASSGS